jgi:hypothetical protein
LLLHGPAGFVDLIMSRLKVFILAAHRFGISAAEIIIIIKASNPRAPPK